MKTDTIAAIATAMSNSGIGIVRISGSEALSIVDQIFLMKNKKRLSKMPTHTIHYGHIYDGKERENICGRSSGNGWLCHRERTGTPGLYKYCDENS